MCWLIEIILVGFRSQWQSRNSILTIWMPSIMPHTQWLLSQWTYTEIKLGTGDAFLPNSAATSLKTPVPFWVPGPICRCKCWLFVAALWSLEEILRSQPLYKKWDDKAGKWRRKHSSQWVRLKGPNWAISPVPREKALIICKIQSRLCIICKILCWYCKWGLIAAGAPLNFILYICELW